MRSHGHPLRLRDRRRRLGGQRARQPALARPGHPGARPGGGPARLVVGRVHPHARGAGLPHRQPFLRLALRVRARAPHGWAPRVSRARKGPGRLEQRQRHDLPARQPDGLRALGEGRGHGDVGPRPLPALLQAHGELPGRGVRRSLPGPRRAARARARTRPGTAVRRLLRRRPGGGPSTHRRRERLPPGGLRGLRPQRASRPAPVGRARLPASGARSPQPDGEDVRADHAGAVGGPPGGGRRVRHAGAPHPPRDGRRGGALRRGDQLASAASAVRRGRRGRAPSARHRRRGGPAGGGREPPGPPRGLRAALLAPSRSRWLRTSR